MRVANFALLGSLAAVVALTVAGQPQTLAAPPIATPTPAAPPTTRPALSAPNPSTMRRAVPELKMDHVALSDALDYAIRDSLGINLYVNWPALEAAGVDRSTPITLRLRGVAARKVLDLILEQAGGGKLAWYVSENILQITTKDLADRDMVTRVYPVQDLIMEIPNFRNRGFDFTNDNSNNGGGTGGGNSGSLYGTGGQNDQNQNNDQNRTTTTERGEQLADLVRSLVTPEAWVENGGYSRIRYFNGNLIVTAPRSVQMQIGG